MPDFDCIGPSRDIFNFKFTVRSGHGKEWMRHDHHPCLHPGMDIAPDREHELRFVKRHLHFFTKVRHGCVKFRIYLTHRMHIVQSAIRIEEFDLLACHDSDHMGSIITASLVDHCNCCGSGIISFSQPAFNINKDVP